MNKVNNIINSTLLAEIPFHAEQVSSAKFAFNNRSLDNWTSIRVKSCDYDDIWAIDFETYKIPLEDWWWVLWKYYRTKKITFELSLVSSSLEWLNNLIDELKFQTSPTEKKLTIVVNWVVRIRTATLTSLKFNRQAYNVNRIWNVILVFDCVKPLSYLLNPSVKTEIWLSGEYQSWIIYNWRADSYPTLTITATTSATWLSFTLNWYEVSITETLPANSVLIIDWETKKCTLNWTEIQYFWPLTPLKYWENIFSIDYSWTFTYNLSYYTRFL